MGQCAPPGRGAEGPQASAGPGEGFWGHAGWGQFPAGRPSGSGCSGGFPSSPPQVTPGLDRSRESLILGPRDTCRETLGQVFLSGTNSRDSRWPGQGREPSAAGGSIPCHPKQACGGREAVTQTSGDWADTVGSVPLGTSRPAGSPQHWPRPLLPAPLDRACPCKICWHHPVRSFSSDLALL